MNWTYAIQLIIISSFMTLLYIGMIKGTTSFSFARVALWACILLPVLLPFMRVDLSPSINNNLQTFANYTLPEIEVGRKSITGISIFKYLYLIISSLFFVRFLYCLISLMVLIFRCPKQKCHNMIWVQGAKHQYSSFFQYLIAPATSIPDSIYLHEEAHYRLGHSADKLVMELLIVFFWFNPFLWWLKRELYLNHEYSADKIAAVGNKDYASLLLDYNFKTTKPLLSQTFSFHPLKNRIIMLHQLNPLKTKLRLSFILFTLGLATTAVLILSCQKKSSTSQGQVTSVAPIGKESVYTYVEQMPQFPGGMDKLGAFLENNLKYPESAKKANIQGRVFVNFVIMEDGSIEEIICRDTKDAIPEFKDEALRVMALMPKWTPGKQNGKPVRVKYNLPISFRLDKNETSK